MCRLDSEFCIPDCPSDFLLYVSVASLPAKRVRDEMSLSGKASAEVTIRDSEYLQKGDNADER